MSDLQVYETFDDMELKEDILRGIYSYGFEVPSAIQQRAIKPLIDGSDLIAQAQSGTGKTATFTIGCLERVEIDILKPQIIILAPNRELAMQIFKVFESINSFYGVKGGLIMGGTELKENFRLLDEGLQYIVGTPGRVFDMLKRYAIVTDKIKTFVLDEADEMLSRGFKEQVYEIFQYIPKQSQICLFSATMPDVALDLTAKFMNDPIRILVDKENLTLEGIQQYYLGVEQENWKLATLYDLYEQLSISQSIIFVNSKRKADFLKTQLEDNDYTAECIHSDLTQKDRNDIMNNFRNGNSRILITTDIIARGIDVQSVSIVINYDIPRYREVYIHRIGRSGRFGRKGIAINFVTEREYDNLKDIQDFYQTEIVPLPENIKDLLS